MENLEKSFFIRNNHVIGLPSAASDIDDAQTSTETTWSSQKTSDKIATKQENIFKKHILSVRAGEANRYVLLASCKVSNLSLHNEPIVLSGVMGENNNANKPLFEVSVSFKTYTTGDTIFTGYINKNISGITDMFVAFDESTNIVYLYLDMCRVWSMASFDITIPQRNAEYYGLTIADVNSDKQSDTFIGTEIARMSTSPNVKILAGLDDTTSSTTSTYSSAKIDKKFALRHFGTDNKTLYLKLQLGAMTTHEPITVTDQYGGQVKILGMYDLSTYKSVKVIRLSYGDWTTHSGTDFTNTSSGDANYKIRRLFYCPDDNNYYLEIRQYSYISVEGAPNATMVTSLPVDVSAMTLIPESQFASKKDIDGTTIQTTTTTGEEYYAITYGDDFNDPANQNILIQYKRSNFPPSTYIFSAVSYATNTRETVGIAKISNNFVGTTYDLRFYIDKDNKTMYLKMPSYSSVSLQNLAFKSKSVTYTKVDAIPSTATTLAVTEYATKEDLKTNSNTDLTAITFDETKVTATSGGHGCTYVVRNGICYVNMDMRIVANGKICTLPKPLMSVVNIPMTVFMHNITGEVEAVNNGILMVNSDGSATTLGALTNESRYMMNFSYPIA